LSKPILIYGKGLLHKILLKFATFTSLKEHWYSQEPDQFIADYMVQHYPIVPSILYNKCMLWHGQYSSF